MRWAHKPLKWTNLFKIAIALKLKLYHLLCTMLTNVEIIYNVYCLAELHFTALFLRKNNVEIFFLFICWFFIIFEQKKGCPLLKLLWRALKRSSSTSRHVCGHAAQYISVTHFLTGWKRNISVNIEYYYLKVFVVKFSSLMTNSKNNFMVI